MLRNKYYIKNEKKNMKHILEKDKNQLKHIKKTQLLSYKYFVKETKFKMTKKIYKIQYNLLESQKKLYILFNLLNSLNLCME